MTSLSSDEVVCLAQDLVYQVAYAFYDPPYILLLKLLVQVGPISERGLADLVGISSNELRKYMGTLHVHRLAKRYVNKEKLPPPAHIAPPRPGEPVPMRIRDVIYWYLDYREFADVVKYRLAMMRKGIDERVKSEVGQRGYICPTCSTKYAPLSLPTLFDPMTNTFQCELDQTELVEHDPSLDEGSDEQASKDRMQKFNVATAPIRDALKAVEGINVPGLNIVAWVAQNVKSQVVDVDVEGREDGEGKRFKVVFGEGERERAEKERQAEAQRVQNALPTWYTHSTVTGSATALGIETERKAEILRNEGNRGAVRGEDEEDDLERHYAELEDDDDEVVEVVPVSLEVKAEVKQELPLVDDEDDDFEGEAVMDEAVELNGRPTDAGAANGGKTVSVAGAMRPIDEVTEDDYDHMTADEYEAYAAAMGYV